MICYSQIINKEFLQEKIIIIGGFHMPLLRFDVIEGRDKETLRKLLDVTHVVVVDAFQVPVRDR